jgi:hypothetical protein
MKSRLMDDGRVRALIVIFGQHEQILAPFAIPETDDGEQPHIHLDEGPLLPYGGKPRDILWRPVAQSHG